MTTFNTGNRRALHVFHYPVFGGPQNEVLRLAPSLSERGWDSAVVLPQEPGNAAERLRAEGVEVTLERYGRVRSTRDPLAQARFAAGLPSDVARLRRLARRAGADLIVGAGLLNPQAALAARLDRLPVVWKLVDTFAPAPLRRALTPLAARAADALMFTGEALVEAHGARPGAARSVVYYPPVDGERFRPSEERRLATRRLLGVPEGAPLIGTVSNLTPQKGLEHFLTAAARIAHVVPEARFVIVGASFDTHRAYEQGLRARARELGLSPERLTFAGYRADPENWYPAMDVKLMTPYPRSEGVTTAVLEAMACGVPVVASRVAALAEAVEEGGTGMLTPPLDGPAAGDATLRLLGDETLRHSMGANARRRAIERFGLSACADAHVRAFEIALATRLSAGGGPLAKLRRAHHAS